MQEATSGVNHGGTAHTYFVAGMDPLVVLAEKQGGEPVATFEFATVGFERKPVPRCVASNDAVTPPLKAEVKHFPQKKLMAKIKLTDADERNEVALIAPRITSMCLRKNGGMRVVREKHKPRFCGTALK